MGEFGFGGRFKTLLNVSRILVVTAVSLAVLFQTEIRSVWILTQMTAPQISSPTINCSPSRANTTFSQHRELIGFRNFICHIPPSLFAGSSQIGFIPILNIWKLYACLLSWISGQFESSPGRIRCEYRLQNCSTEPNFPTGFRVLMKFDDCLP